MKPRVAKGRTKQSVPRWVHYTDEQLLDLRFCDLRLSLTNAVTNSYLGVYIDKLYRELESHGLQFKPHVWLADEWFSPDGIPGFAIPFYLAHPRLARLERKMFKEVEGGNANWLMRILRHETGHAIDTAFRLRRRSDWRAVFGKASLPYPKVYRPLPTSKKFVLHSGHGYAQTHPTEDFAETFAVWLQPRSRWRREYANWPAMQKLQFVDDLMHELRATKPLIRSREVIEPLSENTMTLRDFYRRELGRFSIETTKAYDRPLMRIFAAPNPNAVKARNSRQKKALSATALLRAMRPSITRVLTTDARIHEYLVHNVVRMVIERCRDLKLTVRDSQESDLENTKAALPRLIEHIVFDTLYRRRQQYAL
jgi:hypothetical protein